MADYVITTDKSSNVAKCMTLRRKVFIVRLCAGVQPLFESYLEVAMAAGFCTLLAVCPSLSVQNVSCQRQQT